TAAPSSTDPPTTELRPLSLHDALPISLGAMLILLDMPPLELMDRVIVILTQCGNTGVCQIQHAIADPCDRKHHDGEYDYRESLRSEEHTSALQSRENLVCRLLLEKHQKIRAWAMPTADTPRAASTLATAAPRVGPATSTTSQAVRSASTWLRPTRVQIAASASWLR